MINPFRIIISFLYDFKQHHPLLSFITVRFLSMLIILFILGPAVFGLMSLAPGDIVDKYAQKQLLVMSEASSGNEELFPCTPKQTCSFTIF